MEVLRALKTKRMFVILLLGFSSGLPLMLGYSTIKVWLRREGIDLSTIGYIGWVTIPYSINFIWAPLLDRFEILRFGRRKSWMLFAQVALALSIAGLGLFNPSESLGMVVVMGILISFFSATQDVAIDAYRREILPDKELGIGAAIHVYGYRTAMLVTSGLGLWVVDPETLGFSFGESFFMIAGFMLIGISASLFCSEPTEHQKRPQNLKETVVDPFVDFLQRRGAIPILLFIFFFKFGDAIAGSMLNPFYVDIGFSNSDIAEVAKTFGFFSSMAGLFIGGSLIFRFGILKSLWVYGILQALSTASFAVLSVAGDNYGLFAGVVAFEDLSSGMGTAGLVAYMSGLTNKAFTATQYALLASLASLARTFFSGFAGEIVEAVSFTYFFILGSVFAIPGLVFLYIVTRISKNESSRA